MNRVAIAEKSEAAKDIAGALLGKDPKSIHLPAKGGGWTICAASGHLLELEEPSKIDSSFEKWEVSPLPISFEPWPKRPNGKSASEKLKVIREAVNSADEVYCCGDADDEGQLIVDEILEYFGYDPSDAKFKRVYVNDNLPKNILAAFDAAIPNSECVENGHAAHARQLADKCFGVNESRLATCKLGALVSIGRVQTPTLGLVISRDAAREGHVEREHYELTCEVESDGEAFAFKYKDEALFEDGKHCFNRSALEKVKAQIEGRKVSFDIKLTNKRLVPPLPFELSSLTADMSKRFSMTAQDVMQATQTLRDTYKAITYNRTDSPYLKEEHHRQAPDVTAIVQANIDNAWPIDCAIKSRAFDDSKVTAHHGIIPQEQSVDVSELPKRETEVYEAIAMRYLLQFLRPATYTHASSDAETPSVPGKLVYAADFAIDSGWCASAPKQWVTKKFNAGNPPAAGEHIGVIRKCEITAGKTTPPPAFTDGTLAAAMAGIARYVEDPEIKKILLDKDADSPNEHGSIGTAATRASIIDGLVSHGFLERKSDKARSLVSTVKARKLWDMIPDEIKGVDTTARWWLMQKDIAEGKMDDYSIMRAVCDEFLKHKDSAYNGMTLIHEVGKCPLCGDKVLQYGKAFKCHSNKEERQEDGSYKLIEGCGFKITPWCNKVFTPKQTESLLSGKEVKLKGCKSSKGNTFDCSVKLGPDGRITIVDNGPRAQKSKGKPKHSRAIRGAGKRAAGR